MDINALNKKIDRHLASNAKAPHQDTSKISVLKISTDIVAGGLIGVALGVFLDKWWGCKPLFLIICTIIGLVAGLKNIMISAKNDSQSTKSI
jgi:F0F1-type ATP synthase assembly protein I